MRLLCGDIGGTKTALCVFEGGGDEPAMTRRARLPSADFDSFEALLAGFDPGGPIDAAAFGVAGPVVDGVSRTTNLPWVLAEASLEERLGAPVALVNDFHAMALGVDALRRAPRPEQLCSLQAGQRAPDGPVTVLGAGTGFGCAHVVRAGEHATVVASEAGHADYAPHDDSTEALRAFARARLGGRVSVEHLLSGAGLGLVYDFIVDGGRAASGAAVRAALAAPGADRAGVIGPAGVDGSDPACRAAVDLFVSIYGAESGNVALRTLPRGGLFIAGGVGQRLLPRMTAGGFMAAFREKSPMEGLMRQLPVDLVLDPDTPLRGAREKARVVHLRSEG